MRNLILTSLALAIIAGFNGCSYVTVLRTQELYAVRDSLEAHVDSLRRTMVTEQKAQAELLRLLRADQHVRLGALEKRIAELGSNISDNQYRLAKIDEKTVSVQRKLEAKLSADSLVVASKRMEIEKLFQVASGDFSAGHFDVAMNGFKDLARRFPESPEGRAAYYWVGECAYAKKDYAEAERVLLRYVKEHPTDTKICAGLYKLGLVFEKQGKVKSKEMVWAKLAEQCPGSPEADLVKAGGEAKK